MGVHLPIERDEHHGEDGRGERDDGEHVVEDTVRPAERPVLIQHEHEIKAARFAQKAKLNIYYHKTLFSHAFLPGVEADGEEIGDGQVE